MLIYDLKKQTLYLVACTRLHLPDARGALLQRDFVSDVAVSQSERRLGIYAGRSELRLDCADYYLSLSSYRYNIHSENRCAERGVCCSDRISI